MEHGDNDEGCDEGDLHPDGDECRKTVAGANEWGGFD
jgi:hypothetical protein